MRVEKVRITPIAVPDVPLLNTKGVHGAYFLRSIIEIETDVGLVGVSETYGQARCLSGLRQAADALTGLDPFNLNDLARRVSEALPDAGGINGPTMLADHKMIDVVYGAYEIACLDLQGRALGRPVCDLLGGAVRDEVGFAGYLFFKFAKPSGRPDKDPFGEVMTPDALVEEAEAFVEQHGFRSLKLKGGVLEPELEIETMLKLRERFPEHALRIDPMGAWRVGTAVGVCEALGGILEYLEDPVRGMDAMAELAARSQMPLATNLVVVEFGQVFEAHRKGAVQIVLSDHHYWRGATGAVTLGRMCAAAGMGISMHSNTHLGISLAAMLHVAAATPNLSHDCDTHYPWTCHDVVDGKGIEFRDGRLAVPSGPGLGVSLNHEAMQQFHALYLEHPVKDRDDTEEIRRYVPDYVRKVPRW
ncbi:MAG: glucarate dehydratase [Boseongicola sp. SB0675_bin_26]|nr:glucarate dehydratase [Boseongicola sp. SB0675_bin_26]